MGDRALVTFKSGKSFSPVVYLHWNGSECADWIKAAASRYRKGDESYSAARFAGYCHEQIKGNLSLGLLDSPDEESQADWNKYSHGDAGVFIVDVDTGVVEAHGGYGKSFVLEVLPDH